MAFELISWGTLLHSFGLALTFKPTLLAHLPAWKICMIVHSKSSNKAAVLLLCLVCLHNLHVVICIDQTSRSTCRSNYLVCIHWGNPDLTFCDTQIFVHLKMAHKKTCHGSPLTLKWLPLLLLEWLLQRPANVSHWSAGCHGKSASFSYVLHWFDAQFGITHMIQKKG